MEILKKTGILSFSASLFGLLAAFLSIHDKHATQVSALKKHLRKHPTKKPTHTPTTKIILNQQADGLTGFIGAELNPAPDDNYGYGFSMYTRVLNLTDTPLYKFQMGSASTWITPNNNNFAKPLCPPGSYAYENWPWAEPWADFMQTEEGGAGTWFSTQFPSKKAKYRMNATPDCYTTEISSPGWGFGDTYPLTPNKMGMVQVSNRLVVPPDGMTFDLDSDGDFFGIAYMALPLLPKPTSPVKTGKKSWGIYINSKNYVGLVAIYIADIWSSMSQSYPSIAGRGLDSLNATMSSIGIEVNSVPAFSAMDAKNVTYTRIPQLSFPVEAQETILMRGNRYYSDKAFYTPMLKALTKGTKLPTNFGTDPNSALAPQCVADEIGLLQGPHKDSIMGLDQIVQTFAKQVNGECVMGLQWNKYATAGSFPAYFKAQGNKRIPVTATQVPIETWLQQQTFKPDQFGQDYNPPPNVWTNKYWKPCMQHGVQQNVTINDGSTIMIFWCKYIEQPALIVRGLSVAEAAAEQRFVEMQHEQENNQTNYFPRLLQGKLISMDRAILLNAPECCKVGYVPIVYSQRLKVANGLEAATLMRMEKKHVKYPRFRLGKEKPKLG